MTVKDLEDITARHGTMLEQQSNTLSAHSATLEANTATLNELQQSIQKLLQLHGDSSRTNTTRTPNNAAIQGRPLRLDFPRFEGEDPEGWLFQAEQFFVLNPIAEEQRVTMASIHLKGDAIAWYRWLSNSMGEITWRQFSRALCKRFGSRKNLDPMSSLSKLTQQGTVAEYITNFETLINLVTGLQDPHQVSLFVSGLRADVQAGVRMHRPTSLSHAFDLALCQEEANATTSKSQTSYSYNKPFPRSNNSNTTPKPLPTIPAVPAGVKRLSWAEQKVRREKGLCFNCDETYKPGHRCLSTQLLLMDAYSQDDDDKGSHVDHLSKDQDDVIQVSLHALEGSIGARTMRTTAQIKHTPISVLVDSGSTHNFIHPTVARSCGLPTTSYAPLQVMIADGGYLPSKGVCLCVTVQVQGFSFTTDFTVLAIKGCDIVLGTQWLRTLGCIQWDFGQLVMQFSSNDQVYTIVGNGSPLVQLIDSPTMTKAIQQEKQVYLLSLDTPIPNSHENASHTLPLQPHQVSLKHLLLQFSDVFGVSQTLPPPRTHDHRISLLPNSSPVSVRPYRYPHF